MEMNKPGKGSLTRLVLVLALIMMLTPPLYSASVKASGNSDAKAAMKAMVEKWGVMPVALRLTAANHFIDFRYKVIDSEKAKNLLKRPMEAYLIDEKTGHKMPVPITKIGPIRSSAVDPKKDKHYLVLFENLNLKIERGSLVTIVIGEFRAEHLSVE